MKTKYITIGALLTLTIISIISFNLAQYDKKKDTIVLEKHIQDTDPSCLKMYYYIEQYSDSFGIPKKYAFGIANIESNYNGPFDWNYNHKLSSYAGAVGPMQIMPSTAKFINDEKVTTQKLKNDIEYNVKTSMKLLRHLYDTYGDWGLAFGAYNTGKPVMNRYAKKVLSYKPTWKYYDN